MMKAKNRFATLVMTGLLVVSSQAVLAQGKDMALFLLIGQSNMAGRGPIKEKGQPVGKNVWMLNKSNEWVIAKAPVHFDKAAAGVGLCEEFARCYEKAYPGKEVGLIPCAVGGTSVHKWGPEGALYKQAVNRAKIAMRNGKIEGILWHQGESDAKESVELYKKALQVLMASLRKELEAEKAPIVVGELLPKFSDFNKNLPEAIKGVPLCGIASAEGLKDKGDNLHFGTEALITFGSRYFDVWKSLKK
jgi:UDP-N-acetylenolpyruvoylglucosamine reductase